MRMVMIFKKKIGTAPPLSHLISVERENLIDTADAAEKRQCTRCRSEKPYTAEHWPAKAGKAVGTVCRLCARNRKRDFDRKYKQMRVAARTQSLASLADAKPLAATGRSVSKTGVALPGELPVRQLEVAQALRVGATRLNEKAESILATILAYAADSASPHHEWALRLIAERVIPKKLYEDLGAQAAGIKAGQGTVRPSVTIVVQQAAPVSPDSPPVRVIEGSVIERGE